MAIVEYCVIESLGTVFCETRKYFTILDIITLITIMQSSILQVSIFFIQWQECLNHQKYHRL